MTRKVRGGRRVLHPLAVAALVIAAALAVTYYAFNEGLPLVHGFRVHVVLSASESLRSDSPVRIAGVQVGKVDGVTRGPGNTARATLDLEGSALPLHTDATVRVRPRLFLEGSSYVDLAPGTPGAPIMRDGGTIPLSHTTVAVQAYQVLSTFDRPTREHLQGMLRAFGQSLAGGGASGLREAASVLAPTLRDVAWVTRAAGGSEPNDLQDFVRTAANVTGTLAANRSRLAGLVSDLNTTAHALASSGASLGQTIAGIDAVLAGAPPSLSAFDRALPPLTRLARGLDPALKIAPPLIGRVTGAAEELGRLVAPAERSKLLTALNGVFVSLPTLVRRLGALFPVVKPVTDCVRTHIAPIFLATVPDGALSSGQPVWQEFAHALVGLAGASQNFDANGHTLRILIGAGLETATAVLPGLGKVLATLPGTGPMLGARPQWQGDLTASDFNPGAPCSEQPVPSLSSPTAAPDFTTIGPARTPALTRSGLTGVLDALRQSGSAR
jgi:virulence factor Mce-like protein